MTTNVLRTSGNAPDLLTFRHNPSGRMVYVLPAADYTAAVSLAHEVFPEVDSETSQVTFSITSLVQGEPHTVAISPSAWNTVLATLARFEIVDVHAKRSGKLAREDDGLPMYSASATASSSGSCSTNLNGNARLSLAQRACMSLGRLL